MRPAPQPEVFAVLTGVGSVTSNDLKAGLAALIFLVAWLIVLAALSN